MKHEAVFRFRGHLAPAIYRSVLPELVDMGRTRVELSLEGPRTLALRVRAVDISSLRAALNTWLRLINVAKEMQEIVTDG